MTLPKTLTDSLMRRLNGICDAMKKAGECDGSCCDIWFCDRCWERADAGA
jgi:hypothetical protein